MKRYKIETVVRNDVRLISGVRGKNGVGTLTFQCRKRVKKPVIPGELTFHNETHTIIWGESSMGCTPATFQLVFQLWETPERFLSKEEMKDAVMDDEEAHEGAVREASYALQIALHEVVEQGFTPNHRYAKIKRQEFRDSISRDSMESSESPLQHEATQMP